MADILGDNYTEIPHTGTYGNVAEHNAVADLAAASIADEVQLVKLPAGTKITDIHLVNEALGAGVTIALGWEYTSGAAGGGAAVLLAATVCTAPTTVGRGNFAPVVLEEEAVIIATVGVGAATGQIDVAIQSVYEGTL